MGLAKRCDRCEKLYEPKDIDIRGAIVNGLGLISRDAHNINVVPRRYFDLCPECLLSFANWLKIQAPNVQRTRLLERRSDI